jgi:hypothetical protein
MEGCEKILRLQPNVAEAHVNRGIALLLKGDMEQGWPEYEWRMRSVEWAAAVKTLPIPLWDGGLLRGRTILLRPEQGLGDTIQFIRYAPLVKQRGGTVVFECPKALKQILAGCPGIDQVVEQGLPLPAGVDVHAHLASLPALLGTTLSNIPATIPYLHADPALEASWREKLAANPGFKIGIAWQGNPSYRGDGQRSVPLTRFATLAGLPGVRLFSLQKGKGCEQVQQVAGQFSVIDLGPRLDETAGAFMDTAAVMKNLDLVITSDTAIAHLAGALGVPVWVALAFIPDWRYLLERTDSPWYPTMRLFRQSTPGDWNGVFERIAAEVAGPAATAGAAGQ